MPSQSTLQILIQAVDEASKELESVANGLDATGQKALSAQQQMKAYGDAMQSAGTQLTVAGAALDAFYGGVVASATATQEAQDSLTQSVTDIVKAADNAGKSSGSYATEVAFLKDKIDGYKATIASATVTLDKHTGSAQASAAAHEKASATIATAQANMAKYEQQLELLTNSQGLVGASADDIVLKFENLARANTSLGFSVTDSVGSLRNLFAATKSVPDALAAYQTAMDLARAKQEDLSTATQQVIMATQGQGRALVSVGINIKDGLSGMAALSAIQDVVNGQSQAYAATLAGSMASALQNINKLFTDMGNTQLPMLTSLFEHLNNIITSVDNWTTAHPKLTEALLVFVGVLGVMLTILGGILVIAGLVAAAIAGGLSAAFIGIAAVIALVIAAVAAVAVAIYTNWNKIMEWTKELQANWDLAWQNMGDIVSNIWNTISNTVKSGVNNVISAVNGLINALDSIHISIPAIQIPGTKIGTPALDLGFNIPDIPMLASGGIVYNPMLAMIGESGPEAVVPLSSLASTGGGIGGGTQIVININGGIFPADQSTIKNIGDMLAKSITAQLRTRNYAS